jgi:hypothetical protein
MLRARKGREHRDERSHRHAHGGTARRPPARHRLGMAHEARIKRLGSPQRHNETSVQYVGQMKRTAHRQRLKAMPTSAGRR